MIYAAIVAAIFAAAPVTAAQKSRWTGRKIKAEKPVKKPAQKPEEKIAAIKEQVKGRQDGFEFSREEFYKRFCPFDDFEGYMTPGQKAQFNERMKTYGPIRNILEIGLNAGHSADNFFENCPQLENFISVDINDHPYIACTVQYFSRKYPTIFRPFLGDSLLKVPEFARTFPNTKMDLIFIDGNHSFHFCFQDIVNCREVATEETILWIDDYDHEVMQATDTAAAMGIIEILNVYSEPTYGRRWAEARYLFK